MKMTAFIVWFFLSVIMPSFFMRLLTWIQLKLQFQQPLQPQLHKTRWAGFLSTSFAQLYSNGEVSVQWGILSFTALLVQWQTKTLNCTTCALCMS
jgi:hypothetical protein